MGELFAPFLPIGGCECYCISVRKAFIQIAMLKKGYMSLDDLTDEEIDRIIQYDLEGLDIEELKRKEAQND